MDQSRVNWHNKDSQQSCSHEDIQTGALQRIANATEAMAADYVKMREERDRYKQYYIDTRTEKDRLYRRISALQGVITKLKKKAKQ